jgi:hypothetical protein
MNGKGQTGASDVAYNLISVAYHALQGAETYEQYASDAESRGDQDVAQFFRQAQQQSKQTADQAKQLLAARLHGEVGGAAGMQATGAMGASEGAEQPSAAMGHAGSKPDVGGQDGADRHASVTEGTDTSMAGDTPGGNPA